jgi:hypothetical protein
LLAALPQRLGLRGPLCLRASRASGPRVSFDPGLQPVAAAPLQHRRTRPGRMRRASSAPFSGSLMDYSTLQLPRVRSTTSCGKAPLVIIIRPRYHGFVCPELRVPARTGQFLPSLKAHGPLCSTRQNARHTLTVHGRRIAMMATKVHLPPWSPLRFSIRLQRTEDSVFQGQSHLGTGAPGSQRLVAQSHLPRCLRFLATPAWTAGPAMMPPSSSAQTPTRSGGRSRIAGRGVRPRGACP